MSRAAVSKIATRGEARRGPPDPWGQPAGLAAITRSLNSPMVRLSRALDAERASASNAAHGLRTPVAAALAQVQRLRAELEVGHPRITAVEATLRRMGALVTRLLQLARSEAGLGKAAVPCDVAPLLRLVLEDQERAPGRAGRRDAALPERALLAPVDPDAFAILAGNLLDNAFPHGAPGTR